MTWSNLYPSCNNCNSTYKGKRWSCRLVRPDVDPVEAMFDFEPETGRLAPAPELDSTNRARVRMTIMVYGLNTKERCAERLSILRHLENALVSNSLPLSDHARPQGEGAWEVPYWRRSGCDTGVSGGARAQAGHYRGPPERRPRRGRRCRTLTSAGEAPPTPPSPWGREDWRDFQGKP